jgi:leucyl-tRNA synthetase
VRVPSSHDSQNKIPENFLISSTFYKDALKYGFFELQSARDWYREITADAGGMHVDLVKYWIEIAALLVTPVAPHFTEHLWTTVLAKPRSIQFASWPTPSSAVDPAAVEAGTYMRGTIKTIRDAELALIKKLSRGKSSPYDPKKPKAVRIYVASKFPEWQNQCVEAVKEAYDGETQRVDDAKVREVLQKKGLLKDKRAMPFIQLFKVNHMSLSIRLPLERTNRHVRTRNECSSLERTLLLSGSCCSLRWRS